MNTNQDYHQEDYSDSSYSQSTGYHPEPGTAPAIPPRAIHNWSKNYEDEWAARAAHNSLGKNRPRLHDGEPEPLPRVWNAPR